jgi:hypothetical protein
LGSRRQFLTAAAAFAAGTATVGTADAAQTKLVTLLNGRGVPRKRLGIVGDFYIDYQRHTIYGPKRQSGWGRPTSLIGPAGKDPSGATGAAGAAGPAGPAAYSILHGQGPPAASLGVDNDFYIDTSTTQLYGPREGGVWGSPVSLSGAANITVIDGGSL